MEAFLKAKGLNRRFIQSFLLFFTPYFLVISGGIFGIYYLKSTHDLEKLKLNTQHVIEQQRTTLKAALQTAILDLLVVSKYRESKQFLNREEKPGQTLIEELLAFSGTKKRYDQVRVIDQFGWEQKRINLTQAGHAYAVAADDLQNKSQSEYFRKTMQLGENEIYISDFDLNRERKRFEVPYKPVVRISIPVFDDSGQRKGIFIVNYLGEAILKDYRSLATTILSGIPMLVNEQGCWIIGPDEKSSWSCQIKEKNNLSLKNKDPILWEKINSEDSGTIFNESGLFLFSTFKNELNEIYQSEFRLKTQPVWKILFHIPYSHLRDMQKPFIKNLLIVYISALIIVTFTTLYLIKIRTERNKTQKSLFASENTVKLLSEIPEKNPHPILRINSSGNVVFANTPSKQFLAQAQVKEHERLPEEWLEKINQSLEANSVTTIDINLGDRLKIFNFLAINITDSELITIYAWDVTKQKEYKEQLQLMASVFSSTLEGIIITSPNGSIEKVNPGFSAITGYTANEVIGKNTRMLKSDRHDQFFYKSMWNTLSTNEYWCGEVWNRRKNGEVFPEWLSISTIKDYQGHVSHYIAVFHDISEIKSNEAKLEFQAFHDALTGLPNRVLFNDRLKTSIAHAKRNQLKLAVLFLDLDNFKYVNDSMGHYAGDILLQEVADRLEACSRTEDTIARMGGDEFTMIIQNVADHRSLVDVAERILSGLSNSFDIMGKEVHVSTSIGLTVFPHDGETAETLTTNADLAMYRAKESGKNNYAFFTQDMHSEIVHRMMLEQQLREAISNREFVLYYQPKVDAKNANLVGSEALVRWQNKEGDVISPDEFIPFAEQTGLIQPLGQFILEEACQQAKIWYEAGYSDFPVAVNLSASQFQDENIVHMVENVLNDTGLPPHLLNLEITENTAMRDVATATKTIKKLSEMGVGISLDDFGTGYSSLSCLKQFSLDVLKIDKSFVNGLPHNSDDAAIAKMVISLAKHLTLKVVAEGVEDYKQLNFLNDNNCDEIQGYIFSKPLSADELSDLLAQGSVIDIHHQTPHHAIAEKGEQ